jgi:Ser/Thr protein kinase RdoA (MazF antagonist)
MEQQQDCLEIIDLLPGFADRWLDFRTDSAAYNRFFQNHLPSLVKTLEETYLHLDLVWKDLWPRLAVHGDFHPGNLTFTNGRVSGLFDFDWAHIDFRCMDLAHALAYFCAVWGGPRDGCLDADKMKTFMAAYQNAEHPAGGLDPLNASELHHLPLVFQATNFCVLDWILDYHQRGGAELDENLKYLQHQINLINWCGRESRRLAQAFLQNGS